MWGKVCYQFAELLANWRQQEAWRHVAPSWEAFILEHIKLPQDYVNELCELASRSEARRESNVEELEPFLPTSVQEMGKRIRRYLKIRPDFSCQGFDTQNGLETSEFVEFTVEEFRIYIWFEYVMPLDGQPHYFARPWIDTIDFQLCGSSYGGGLYSWLNISERKIQLCQKASTSTLTAWRGWAEALQEELRRELVPAGEAIAL